MKHSNLAASAQVHFDNVSVHYYSKLKWLSKPFKAIDQLSLTVDKQNLAIVGPSGAGKSTLIELLFGLRKPTKGEVYVCDQPLSGLSNQQRQTLCKHIQLIPQEPQSSLNPYYSVRQILTEPLFNLGECERITEKVKQVLVDVGLDLSVLDRNSQQLSVGQAQRIAIARALIVEPCVLVADEPISSLDPVSRKQILALLAHIQATRHMRLILVTHDLKAAQALCDEILVLDKGRAVEHGDMTQLINQPDHEITQALIATQQTNNEFIHTNGEVLYAL